MVSWTGKLFFPCPRSRLRIWSRETGLAVPSRVSLLILHTQAESGAYLRDSSRFPRRRPFIPVTSIGSVRILSDHATAYRWRSLPRVRRTGPVVLKIVPVTGAAFSGITMDLFLCASLFPHPPYYYWYIAGMCGTKSIEALLCTRRGYPSFSPSGGIPIKSNAVPNNGRWYRWHNYA